MLNTHIAFDGLRTIGWRHQESTSTVPTSSSSSPFPTMAYWFWHTRPGIFGGFPELHGLFCEAKEQSDQHSHGCKAAIYLLDCTSHFAKCPSAESIKFFILFVIFVDSLCIVKASVTPSASSKLRSTDAVTESWYARVSAFFLLFFTAPIPFPVTGRAQTKQLFDVK